MTQINSHAQRVNARFLKLQKQRDAFGQKVAKGMPTLTQDFIDDFTNFPQRLLSTKLENGYLKQQIDNFKAVSKAYKEDIVRLKPVLAQEQAKLASLQDLLTSMRNFAAEINDKILAAKQGSCDSPDTDSTTPSEVTVMVKAQSSPLAKGTQNAAGTDEEGDDTDDGDASSSISTMESPRLQPRKIQPTHPDLPEKLSETLLPRMKYPWANMPVVVAGVVGPLTAMNGMYLPLTAECSLALGDANPGLRCVYHKPKPRPDLPDLYMYFLFNAWQISPSPFSEASYAFSKDTDSLVPWALTSPWQVVTPQQSLATDHGMVVMSFTQVSTAGQLHSKRPKRTEHTHATSQSAAAAPVS
eukprot:m.172240 g.172240  ORF g.172240 m.172240 type:complete len:356 (+) comp14573_c1_seq1:455-1522(+)